MKVDQPSMICPDWKVPISFVRERTEVTTDEMHVFLWDYWCTKHGLWQYNPDTKQLAQKQTSSFEER